MRASAWTEALAAPSSQLRNTGRVVQPSLVKSGTSGFTIVNCQPGNHFVELNWLPRLSGHTLPDNPISAFKKPASQGASFPRRLLVIDDDVELCELLAEYLQPEGFRVDALYTGINAADIAVSQDYSLVVLDVMLPGTRGFDVLQQIRAKSRIPVIMLTARGEDVDRILGLEIGADDYLPKPFNPRELAARIHAVLRRTMLAAAGDDRMTDEFPLFLADLQLHPASRSVLRDGKELSLTSVEFDLLRLFLSSVGTVVQREQMARDILGRELAPFDRSIDVHVSNLRRKLGPAPDGSERIKAVRGVGYLYAAPAKSKMR